MITTLKRRLAQSFSLNNPVFLRRAINLYPPYIGAGVRAQRIDYQAGVIEVSMPLTRLNRNIVGTQFGGSLYSMTDPFLMLLLMARLGKEYVVWDKSAHIDFVKAGKSRVFARFEISSEEVAAIIELAKDGRPVFRDYELDITDSQGEVVAHVKKQLYIRLRAFSKSKDAVSRF